ncbi:Zeatin O-glucosyltransferase [Sesamum alatum]|uniref:Glycosyltransferase n=1 Tax=Sesamum alatum TaxID=300844 RepID=A0AAE1XJF4_9LAMI|nr:Zeatin O-glucosyltransferase [Sesamum alatum]
MLAYLCHGAGFQPRPSQPAPSTSPASSPPYNIPSISSATTTHNPPGQAPIHGCHPSAITNIHFHDFPTPHFSNPLPDPNSDMKFPTQILPLLRASTLLRQPVYDLVQGISATVGRVVVVYDSMMPYVVQDVYNIPNAESYCFQSISAFSLYSFYWEATGKPVLPTEAEIVGQVPSMEGCFPPEFSEISKLQQNARNFNSGDLYNTSRVIEGLFVDLLAKEKTTGTEKNWAVGPFNPVSIPQRKDIDHISGKCMEWLDKQELNSVIFVSFGTTSSLSNEQISELALGLERSEQKFIWVLRDADKGDVFEGEVRRAPLPGKYEERVEGRGLIVRDWAPQLEILGHPSTGGFISHCGWNSCIESISMGVPIAAWPMHSDQPRNAVLITKVLRIGVEIKDWNRRDEVVSSREVEKGVRRLMASAEGDEIRKRAQELGDAVRKSVMKGGVSNMEMDDFIAHISR